MPLSEVPHATTRGNHESSQSRMTNCSPDLTPFMPDHGFVELLWENGQIMMQGQSNRPNKRSFGNTFSHNGRFQEKDSRDVVMPKVGQFTDSMFNDFSHSVPSSHIGLNAQDDDMVPWLNYPIVEDSLHHDYCSEFSDFPGFDPNSLSTHNNAVTADRSSGLVHTARDSHNNAGGSDPSRVRTSQLFQLSQQCQSSVPMTKSRATEFCVASTGSGHQGPCGDLPDKNLQKQDVGTSKPPPCLMNFPQFSRPVALAKSNLQSVDRLRSHEKASTTASSNHLESTVINSASNLVIQSQSSTVPPKLESLRSAAKLSEEAVCQVDTQKNTTGSPDHVTRHSSKAVPSVALVRSEVEKGPEAVVASSSVCSANSTGPESNDCKNTTKRKDREGEESGYQSEDLEDESVGLKKPANGRGMSAKRTRAAEVHNLSERRRRDRINEKMRALQELIPNCNKVDKASMLDEAIEYLKTLQLQVQIMSMGSGLCMPPMILPAGMQYLSPHPMAHFTPMGVNMGMGMGLGYGMGMLDMHRPQFACPSMPVGPSLHGMPGPTSLQMLGNPGQGFNVSMPHPPPFASLSGHSTMVNSAPGAATSPLPVADTAPSSDSKNQEQLNLHLETNSKTRELKNQTSTQVAKQSFEQSALLQMSNQTLHASRN